MSELLIETKKGEKKKEKDSPHNTTNKAPETKGEETKSMVRKAEGFYYLREREREREREQNKKQTRQFGIVDARTINDDVVV